MDDSICYTETISSKQTEDLFIALTLIFGGLCTRRASKKGLDAFAFVFGGLCLAFLFYAMNYRVLTIRLTQKALQLKFGMITWTEPYENIAACSIDDISGLMRYGGAGVHFMSIQNRYRASFNFLEYSRVVVALKKKAGPVCDISFTTRNPEKVLQLIQRYAAL